MKAKILGNFQICVSVPLNGYKIFANCLALINFPCELIFYERGNYEIFSNNSHERNRINIEKRYTTIRFRTNIFFVTKPHITTLLPCLARTLTHRPWSDDNVQCTN